MEPFKYSLADFVRHRGTPPRQTVFERLPYMSFQCLHHIGPLWKLTPEAGQLSKEIISFALEFCIDIHLKKHSEEAVKKSLF